MATSSPTVARLTTSGSVTSLLRPKRKPRLSLFERGTDLTCGNEYAALVEAVKKGLITEAEIDTLAEAFDDRAISTRHVRSTRDGSVCTIPFSENDTPEHRQLALKTARESIVLLKNANARCR